MNEEGMVTISQELYTKLLEDQYFLECLEAYGVDNWEGYDDAVQEFRRGEED